MCSLRERQRLFADALLRPVSPETGAEPIAPYRHSIRRNYRNALGATYRVVKRLVGEPFFNAAVDAYVAAHPSGCADLNVYGDRFDRFLADYGRHLAQMIYLTDAQIPAAAITMPSLELYRRLGVGALLRGHGGELIL